VFANKHGSIPPHPRAPASALVVTLMGTYFISRAKVALQTFPQGVGNPEISALDLLAG
jgi:hypothetical protein